MKIISALKTGIFRSVRIWKGVLIVWFLSLLLVSFLAIPMKGALKTGFGKSMITEKLMDGINVEVLGDLGSNLNGLLSFFSSGLLLLILFGILMNSFLSGGLFDSLKPISERFSPSDFFKASSKNFWSFLAITIILDIMILLLIFLIISLPLTIVGQTEVPTEGAVFKTFITVMPIFLLLYTLLLVVADYARAWQAGKERNAIFKAIGFGFSQTFRTFLSSYPLMIILVFVQVLYGWLVFKILSGMEPVSGGGVFLLFLISQFLFFLKILLKVWRYGSVTVLMEENAYLKNPI